MTFHCAVLDDYQGVAESAADWSALGERAEVVFHHDHLTDDDALVERLGQVDCLVVMRERTPLSAGLLARLPRLRLVITSGMRNASIDLSAASAQGVTVCGTASSSAPPTEHTWALVLGLARRLVEESVALREGGPWQHTLGVDLEGRTLGLLGLGKIGSRMARIGAAFGMQVLAWSPHLTPERAEAGGAELAPSLDALMARSDVLSLHLQLAESTRGIVGRRELGLMRPSALLVNTSRAGLVDQEALVDAVRTRAIAGAAVDVFEEEPLPLGDPLRSEPRILATPHLGYVSEQNYRTYFTEAVADIAAFLDGHPVRVLAAPDTAPGTTEENR